MMRRDVQRLQWCGCVVLWRAALLDLSHKCKQRPLVLMCWCRRHHPLIWKWCQSVWAGVCQTA